MRLETLLDEELERPERAAVLNNYVSLCALPGLPVERHLAELSAPLRGSHGPADVVSLLVDLRALVAYGAGRLPDAHALYLESHALSPYPASVLLAARCSAVAARRRNSFAATSPSSTPAARTDPPSTSVVRRLGYGLVALDGHRPEALAGYRDVLAGLARPGAAVGRGHHRHRHGQPPGPDRSGRHRGRRGRTRRPSSVFSAAPFVERLATAHGAGGRTPTRPSRDGAARRQARPRRDPERGLAGRPILVP